MDKNFPCQFKLGKNLIKNNNGLSVSELSHGLLEIVPIWPITMLYGQIGRGYAGEGHLLGGYYAD